DGRLVGVVIPDVARMRVPEMLAGLEGGLREAGYSLLLGGSGDWREQEAEQIGRLVGQGVSGLILYPVDGASNAPLLRRLRADGLPVVLIDRYLPELEVDAVVADNIVGACQAVGHLLRVGRQRIGFVSTNNLGTSSIAERRAGYLLALEQLATEGGRPSVIGPTCRELRRLFRWPSEDQAARHNLLVLEQYLSRPDRPDAVFAVNDMVAFQVLEAASRLGLHIPDDLAVVGFDNLGSPDYAGVPLTTVEQPREAIGRVAAELLHDAIVGRRTEPARVVLATRLIVRQSSMRQASVNHPSPEESSAAEDSALTGAVGSSASSP
ncbi:MAG: substrate-binding domain-containing protein, partial [Chloroflexota bacterium]|nr:substrate-binding domain-containing protein [Chloroflexota bacterium]